MFLLQRLSSHNGVEFIKWCACAQPCRVYSVFLVQGCLKSDHCLCMDVSNLSVNCYGLFTALRGAQCVLSARVSEIRPLSLHGRVEFIYQVLCPICIFVLVELSKRGDNVNVLERAVLSRII